MEQQKMDEAWEQAQIAVPVIEWVRYLGITDAGHVRVQLGYEHHENTVEMRADDLFDLERATGAVLSPEANGSLRDGVWPNVPRKLLRRFRADTLARLEFPEVQWVIKDTLPEGLAVLAGKPKVGKSWYAMGQAVEVAKDGGSVLYLALEDPPRRLQKRMEMVLKGRPAPNGLEFHTVWPRLDDGGLEQIAEWLKEHPETARLIVIDTIAKVRPERGSNEDQYLGDYGVWGGLQALTIHHPGVAIEGVHHQRKGASEDILETVLGSQGVTGVADTILILTKPRGESDGELFVTGRDIDERERALTFEAGVWTDVGDAGESRRSEERNEVIALLKVEGPQKANEVQRKLGLKYQAAYKRLTRAVEAGEVKREGDTFSVGEYIGSRESTESTGSSESTLTPLTLDPASPNGLADIYAGGEQ